MSKSSSSNKSEQATRRFKILSDQNRRNILGFLIDGPRSVTEISETLDIERTLVSHHLKVLRDEKLVATERRGKEIYYSIEQGLVIDANKPTLDLDCCEIRFR